MNSTSCEALRAKKCLPCEGGVEPLGPDEARQYGEAVPQWGLSDDGKLISRKVPCRNFVEAVRMINRIAEVAESEQHHPDLHLTGYRKLRVDLTTHAIDGLSENDFIVAAKIDQLLEDSK
jgi:4a-hydroxytetrahydrobiopterin dehydratase